MCNRTTRWHIFTRHFSSANKSYIWRLAFPTLTFDNSHFQILHLTSRISKSWTWQLAFSNLTPDNSHFQMLHRCLRFHFGRPRPVHRCRLCVLSKNEGRHSIPVCSGESDFCMAQNPVENTTISALCSFYAMLCIQINYWRRDCPGGIFTWVCVVCGSNTRSKSNDCRAVLSLEVSGSATAICTKMTNSDTSEGNDCAIQLGARVCDEKLKSSSWTQFVKSLWRPA